MKKKTEMVAVLLLGMLAMSGLGLAAQYGSGPGLRDEDSDGTPNRLDEDYERPMDGSNSPWVTGDDRLERFQQRFDLSDDQLQEIKEGIASLSEEDINHDEIRVIVNSKLKEFGVEDPEFGGPRTGDKGFGRNSGHNTGRGQGRGRRNGGYGDCPYAE